MWLHVFFRHYLPWQWPATTDPTLDLSTRYSLQLDELRQCGLRSLPNTSTHGWHWDSNPTEGGQLRRCHSTCFITVLLLLLICAWLTALVQNYKFMNIRLSNSSTLLHPTTSPSWTSIIECETWGCKDVSFLATSHCSTTIIAVQLGMLHLEVKLSIYAVKHFELC